MSRGEHGDVHEHGDGHQRGDPHQHDDPHEHGDPQLCVRGVTLRYRSGDRLVTATYRVSFDVLRSDRFVVLGPSGCGKSTLLKAVAGFLEPVEGRILLSGQEVRKPGPDRIVVFQEFDQLLPWKSVRDNVLFALTASGKLGRREARERADFYIRKVGLENFASSFPHTLSGGMKQRAAIARAMAMEPDVLLMDEPFAALDALTREKMQDELLRLWADTRFTLLFVTHSISEAIRVGNRILLLSPHPGRVRAEINCSGVDETDGTGRKLSARIAEILFGREGAPQPIPEENGEVADV
jgi:NitT/TauT family transport system ATP-binding protein